MTELHHFDRNGAACKTPREACEQSFRRGAHHAVVAISELCRVNPGHEAEIVRVAEELTREARNKWPIKWGDWYMHQLMEAIRKRLRLKDPLLHPKP